MGRAWLLLGVAATLATIGAVTAQVIAAPPPADQPTGADAPVRAGDWLSIVLAVVFVALIAWRRWDRLPARPRTPVPFPPLVAVGLFVVAIIIAQTGMLLALRALGIDDPSAAASLSRDQQARLGLARYAAEAVVLVIIAVQLVRTRRKRAEAPMPPIRAAATGLGGLILVWPIMGAAGMVVLFLTGAPSEPIAHETLRVLTDPPRDGSFLVLAALAVIAAPITEELLYRTVLQPAFRVLGGHAWLGIAMTSMLFAVMHIGAVSPHALASLFVLSLGFGWAYEKTGRVIVPIVMHMLFNAGNIAVALAVTG
jgi:membrane protease YdiL (CAAX protease family)